MNELTNIIISAVISGIVSLLISLVSFKYQTKKEKKEERWKSLSNKFYILRDSIHKGRAMNFSDLSKEEQEEILKLLIETDRYQSEELNELVYVLKTNSLDNFYKNNKEQIDLCNKTYNKISEIILKEYERGKGKY